MVDACNAEIGALRHQREGDHRQPLVFIAKALQPTEQRDSTFRQEMVAAYLNVKHFHHCAEGRCLIIFTDHKPLTSAMSSHSSQYKEREIRQLDFLSPFDLKFRRIRGADVMADALSRIEINNLEFPIPSTSNPANANPVTTQTARSGRRVRFPDRCVSYHHVEHRLLPLSTPPTSDLGGG